MDEHFKPQHDEFITKFGTEHGYDRIAYVWIEQFDSQNKRITLRFTSSPDYEELEGYEFVGFNEHGMLPIFKKI
jgi:hypothetical protein